jgi:molybdate transport system permease protein
LFRHPPNFAVGQITGCKNFSRARAAASDEVEALDWGCRLRVAQPMPATLGHVAIRAHHIRVHADARDIAPNAGENLFPCWLAAATEAPFRVTLYLRLNTPSSASTDFHVQAEISKDEWENFKDLPQPWCVELAPDRLFLLPD